MTTSHKTRTSTITVGSNRGNSRIWIGPAKWLAKFGFSDASGWDIRTEDNAVYFVAGGPRTVTVAKSGGLILDWNCGATTDAFAPGTKLECTAFIDSHKASNGLIRFAEVTS